MPVLGRQKQLDSEVAHRVKALATKAEDLSSITGTYIVKAENSLPKVTLLTFHVPWHKCTGTHVNAYTHEHTQNSHKVYSLLQTFCF